MKKLIGRRQMVVFVRPKQMGVTEPQKQSDDKKRRKELPDKAVWQAFIIEAGRKLTCTARKPSLSRQRKQAVRYAKRRRAPQAS